WEYLTTPIAATPESAHTIRQHASSLSQTGHYALAECAYEVQMQADPRDPQVIWERAHNLRRLGRADEAKSLLEKLAAGKNDERWDWRRAAERAEEELKR